MLIDTHAHLFWDSYKDDLTQVIQNAENAGVTTIINVGVDIDFSQKALEQISSINQFSNIAVYSTIAIHPEEAILYWNNESKISDDITKLEKIYLSNPNKVIAVGECGLDYAYFNREGYLPKGLDQDQAKNLQKKLFVAQINLAKKHNLPLILHVRDDRSKNLQNTECWDEAIRLTRDHFGVYHCYSGLPVTTHSLSPNFLVSFAGNITYPNNQYLREAIKLLPLEKIVLETDCPFLPPQSLRGKRNEPASIRAIAQVIAELKNIEFKLVATQTTKNITDLLKLSNLPTG